MNFNYEVFRAVAATVLFVSVHLLAIFAMNVQVELPWKQFTNKLDEASHPERFSIPARH
jgi:hypothetical protein